MVKKTIVLCSTATLLSVSLLLGMAQTAQPDAALQAFWDKFKSAVIREDKQTVAGFATFPVDMPYGMKSIRNRTQFIKRYREVFHGETNAVKCFAKAKPQQDPERPKEFTIGCDNGSGQEVIIYRFVLTKTGWKFKGLDNINE